VIELGADGSFDISGSTLKPPPPPPAPPARPKPAAAPATRPSPPPPPPQAPAQVKETEPEPTGGVEETKASMHVASLPTEAGYEIFELRKEGGRASEQLQVVIALPGVQDAATVKVAVGKSEVRVLGGGYDSVIRLPHEVDGKTVKARLWKERITVTASISRHRASE
jgi:hypothetical protein